MALAISRKRWTTKTNYNIVAKGVEGASEVKLTSGDTEAGVGVGGAKPGGEGPCELAKEPDLSHRWWRTTDCDHWTVLVREEEGPAPLVQQKRMTSTSNRKQKRCWLKEDTGFRSQPSCWDPALPSCHFSSASSLPALATLLPRFLGSSRWSLRPGLTWCLTQSEARRVAWGNSCGML